MCEPVHVPHCIYHSYHTLGRTFTPPPFQVHRHSVARFGFQEERWTVLYLNVSNGGLATNKRDFIGFNGDTM